MTYMYHCLILPAKDWARFTSRILGKDHMSKDYFSDPVAWLLRKSWEPRQNSKNSPGGSNSLLFCRFPGDLRRSRSSDNGPTMQSLLMCNRQCIHRFAEVCSENSLGAAMASDVNHKGDG